MPSERVQRRVDRFLDEADEAAAQSNWALVRDRARNALALDPDSGDAVTFLAAAERMLTSDGPVPNDSLTVTTAARAPEAPGAQPTSFVSGRYVVKRFLGEGGKKKVYLVHDTRLNRDVAYAEIKADGLDAEGLVRITREAQAMGKLGDHPHIVTVHDIGEEDGPSTGSGGPHPYLVSQLMGGGDVAGLIEQAEGHQLSFERALQLADQVCRALEYAHSHDIVHRDLKPGNVWLTADPSTGAGQSSCPWGRHRA